MHKYYGLPSNTYKLINTQVYKTAHKIAYKTPHRMIIYK